MGELDHVRRRIRSTLDLNAPVDALYAYYVLYHDPSRTQLLIHEDSGGHLDGFVAVCQTGQRLFEPTVVLRTADARVAVDLLQQALDPGRGYYVITTSDLCGEVGRVLRIQSEATDHIYRLDLSRFDSAINVLIVQEEGVGSGPLFVIRRHGSVLARSGVNWLSPHFAEVSVQTEPVARGRGWGKAVVQACTRWVLQSGRKPLYIVNSSNDASVTLAKSVGYVDTGAREYAADGMCCV